MTRSTGVTVAAILQLLMSLFGVIVSLTALPAAANATAQDPEGPPYIVLMLALILSVLGLVAAYGLWKNQRWAKILTIVVRTVDSLSALPGLLFAPTIEWRLAAVVGVSLSILIIALLLRREPRLVTA